MSGTRSRTYEGSGIGLALVQQLVKLHGGTIRVISQVNSGTTFIISLPLGSTHLPSERIGATRTLASTALGAEPYVLEASRWLPEEETGTPRQGDTERSIQELTVSPCFPLSPFSPSSARILLVDDNADMRDYVKRLLSQYTEVETVSDGLEALEAIARRPPDLVLTDVMMPRLDGFGLLRELRTNPRTKEIPIILLSARAGEESRIEGLEAGADDYLIKPFSARELLARVESNLKLAQLRQAATQKEQALRMEVQAVKDNLESILTRIADQFLAFDREWRYTYVNGQVTKVTGIPKDKLLGRSVWEIFPDIIDTQFYTEVHRALAEQVPVRFEYFYTKWNRWFENRVYPSANGVSIIVTEITVRKQAEAALRRSEERLKIAQLAAKIGTWDWDLVADSIFWSEEYYTLYGLDPAIPSTYENWLATILEADRATANRFVRDVLQQKQTHLNFEFRVCHPTLGIRWFACLGQIFYDSNGEPKRAIGISIDISDRKADEMEREQLLAREQKAREEAETANRIKDEFLAVLSHELRSPLNPILGWSKLLRVGNLDAAKTAQALATIERNAKLQSELIEDLLDVSRILQGKLSLNVKSVSLITIIRAAMETVRLAAEAKSIEIKTHLSDLVGDILGDATRLQQIIWNLLSNAIKFTPEGGKVTVRLESVANQAQITVIDTGKGIASDFLPYVFDYFRQADGSTTRQFGGLGLGLAIVRHLVELHGGTVWAESRGEGLGATFTVRLPLMPTQTISEPDFNLPRRSLDLMGVQVLIVDDEPDTRDLIAFILEEAGAQVITATTAEEAFAAFVQSQPDAILSDIGMPNMDGYTLIRQIRALPIEQGGQIPAIALTAYVGDLDRQQAIQCGFQDHLAKPVEPEVLVKAMVSLLSSRIFTGR